MKVKVAKWGNSVAVRLPRRAVEALGIVAGQDVDLAVRGRTVELSAPPPRSEPITIQWILAEMQRLGPDAEPKTVDWGGDRGSEIIDDDWSPA